MERNYKVKFNVWFSIFSNNCTECHENTQSETSSSSTELKSYGNSRWLGYYARSEGQIGYARYAQYRRNETVATATRTFCASIIPQCKQSLRVQTSSINKLNVIHVAGTKGKGSTCAFIDAFLQSHFERSGSPRKTGLYTSPHLIVPEERIRINMRPLERDVFVNYFFEVFDTLSMQDSDAFETSPRLLQLFLLVAIHSFIREGVDAAIIETHHGGEYDATNVIEHPVVTAITSLGMDHVSQLGPSLENIAWHKAGIFKPGATAFSVVEEVSVAKVLQDRAAEKGVELQFIDLDPSLPQDEINLKPDVQRLNCSLALAVVRFFIGRGLFTGKNAGLHSDDILQGIRRFSWPGRFQVVVEHVNQWFLDGAHNQMSVAIAGKWFMEASTAQRLCAESFEDVVANRQDRSRPIPRILIFGQVTEQRDAITVIRSLEPGDISIAIFTLYNPIQDFESPTGL
jgi:folylpolyglutamate synthase